MTGRITGVAIVIACGALACAYEQVLPWKEVDAETIAPVDISFSDLDVDISVDAPADTTPSPELPDPSGDTAPDATSEANTAPEVDADEVAPEVDAAPEIDAEIDSAPEVEIDATPEVEIAPEVIAPFCGDGVCDRDEDCLSCNDCACPERCGSDLFMSEYVEGTSWNKAIEIANFTGRPVDLQGYALWKITNGGDWSEGAARPLRLSGVLAHGDVYVVCHGGAEPALLAQCDLQTTTDFAEFNGDDAIALVRNGAIIDVIGSDGADPGTGWTVANVPNATADHTLRRMVDVLDGSDQWGASEPTWNVLSSDMIGGPGGLGALRVRAMCDVTSAPRAGINEVAAASGADFVEIGAFAFAGQQGALQVGGWVIASTGGRFTLPPGTSIPLGGLRAFNQSELGFALGLVDRVWLYDDAGVLQDVVGWHGEDLTGASYGRLPDLVGDFGGNTLETPNSANRNPETWCGDGTCQDDEDCGRCDEDCPVCLPGAGDLVITEIMADPASGPEWFEVVNVTALPFDLTGVVIRDDGSDFHQIGAASLAPGELLVITSGPLTGAPNQYVFSGMSLAAGADQIILERDGVVIDRVSWTSASGRGVARVLSGDGIDATLNDSDAAWCAAPPSIGQPNPLCAECGDLRCEQAETCASCSVDCGQCAVDGCAQDLFISEYLEGNSYNKAIEIANFTGRTVDLSRYALWRIINGGSTWSALSAAARVALSGSLAHGATWVGCNTSSNAAILARCDVKYGQASAPTNFTGDDAVALVRDGVIIDVIGVEALDPGDGWAVGGVQGGTANHTLVRKSNVQVGTPDWALSAASQWEVRGIDDASGLGEHAIGYTCTP